MIFYPVHRFCNDGTDFFRRMRYCDVLNNYNRVTFASVQNQEGVKILFKTFARGAPDIHKCTIPGAATVRIAIPTNMQSNLIFHYNLKFYESEGDTYDGVSLKRFVMQVEHKTFYIYYLKNLNILKN